MAGDWIKMRTDLYRDPKVILMAEHLMDPEGPLARFVSQNRQCDMTVTRNVMRNVTVGALVSVWGVARHQGKRDGDALRIDNVTPSVVDDIAELDGFGEAMLACGWLVEDSQGIVFPKFFAENNVDPTEEQKAKNKERQRRYRESKRNVTRDVTVASQRNARVEKSREENKNPPIGPPKPKTSTAIPAGFELTESMRAYAKDKTPGIDPDHQFEKFNAYHLAKGSKFRDWQAAWRTWVLNAAKWEKQEPAAPARSRSLYEVMGIAPPERY